MRAPSSTDVPILLLNQPINIKTMEHYYFVQKHSDTPQSKILSILNKFVLLRFTFLQICFTKASVREVISTNTAKDGLKKL